ncbi:hypothetical protein Q6346_12865 [Isoptericola sp. b490]|uniref:hypothetical protein n=1 Tax=Actinotalea lenta TaxID=3064654 RepID=UPI0027141EF9|nr:hypothetical protein [Isoptericola sp. b490]MDO8122201.1 hypothetical protein [Isoptericola sp. b490]
MEARRRTRVAALAVAMLAGGCTPPDAGLSSPDSGSTSTGSPTSGATSPGAVGTPAPAPTAPAPTAPASTDPAALPPGFPEPGSLIGGELVTTFSDSGATTTVDGEDLGLTQVFGACFDGDAQEYCPWSIEGLAQPGAGGLPEPTGVNLLLLLKLTGMTQDGTPTWMVVDAIATHAPDGKPALLEYCQGSEGVAFYPASDQTSGMTVPAAAAWASDVDHTSLVEQAPGDISCEAFGE